MPIETKPTKANNQCGEKILTDNCRPKEGVYLL